MVFCNKADPPRAAKLSTRSSKRNKPLPEVFDAPDPEEFLKKKRNKRGGKKKNKVPLIFANAGQFRELLESLNSIELNPQEEEMDNDEVQIPPQVYQQLSLFIGDLSFRNSFRCKLPNAEKFEENIRKAMMAAKFNANDVNRLRQW